MLEESQAITLRLGSEGEQILADTLNWLGLTILFNEADALTPKGLFERSFELHQKWGDLAGATLSTFHLGIAAMDQHDYTTARAHLETSLEQFRQRGDLFFISRVSIYLGYIALHRGDLDAARYFFEQNQRIDTELQFWDGIAESWRNLGYVYRQESKYKQASQCLENSVLVCLEHALDKYEAFYTAGLMALYGNNYALAVRRFTHQLNLSRRPDKLGNIGPLLLGPAAVSAGINQPERAARLFGAAQTYCEMMTYPLSEIDRVEMERHLQIARNQLGAAAFETLQSEGRALTVEQAIDLAWDTTFPGGPLSGRLKVKS